MSEAMFSVVFAGPLVTLQDTGRPQQMRYGVAASGPMDRLAFDAAHAALGNIPGQAAIEVSLGGLILQCDEGAVTVAIAGGDFVVEHAGQKTTGWRSVQGRRAVGPIWHLRARCNRMHGWVARRHMRHRALAVAR